MNIGRLMTPERENVFVQKFLDDISSNDWECISFISHYSHLAHDQAFLALIEKEILSLYKRAPGLSDALSRLAFLLWGEGFCGEARRLWETDIESNKCSWWQKLRYADTYAETDLEYALTLAAEVYDDYPEAMNAYSSLAWRIRQKNATKAEELFELDISISRITPEFMGKYIIFLANHKKLDKASQLLEENKNELPEKNFHQMAEIFSLNEKWDFIPQLYKNAPFPNWFNTPKGHLFKIAKKDEKCSENNSLFAFYDLLCAAPTYDFTAFLGNANMIREKEALDGIEVVIVPATPSFYPEWYPLPAELQDWRLHNIVIPSCQMLQCFKGIHVCHTRDEALLIEKSIAQNIYPLDYSVLRPTVDFQPKSRSSQCYCKPYVTPPEFAVRAVKRYLNNYATGRKVVTITLRETNVVNKDRNSNVDDWIRFAQSLDQDIYFPIFIRDLEKCFDTRQQELAPYLHLPESSWNLQLRCALYELSYINMGVNTGPMMWCMMNPRTRCLVFKIISQASLVASYEFINEKCGLKHGEQRDFASPYQRFIWEDDQFKIIQEEFFGLVKDIEKDA